MRVSGLPCGSRQQLAGHGGVRRGAAARGVAITTSIPCTIHRNHNTASYLGMEVPVVLDILLASHQTTAHLVSGLSIPVRACALRSCAHNAQPLGLAP